MRYTIKDFVFTYVFKQPEYTRKLYLPLHPEDTDVTEADCKLVTLENILMTGLYNDFGIQDSAGRGLINFLDQYCPVDASLTWR